MKRSRAYDDLVALAEEADMGGRRDPCAALLGGWEPLVSGPSHRVKRSRACGASSAMDDEDAAAPTRHSLQFSMELPDLEQLSVDVAAPLSSASSSSSSLATADSDDDALPLRRTAREQLIRRQQQKKVVVSSSAPEKPALFSKSAAVLGAPETPESRVLRAGFARDAQFIEPLDKCHQPQPFDISAFIMLSISPKR